MLLGALIGIGGVLSAITFATNFLTFTLMFAGCFGCCNGLMYTIPLKICWDYFPERKGMVSGTIICGFGLGSFIFSFLSTVLTNPNNSSANHEVDGLIYYDQEVASRVPTMIYKFVATWIVLFSISFYCLKPV